MSINKKIYIIGGGTVYHVASHLALSAPAYGETARKINELVKEEIPDLDSLLYLTKMAGGPHLETNEDVSNWVDAVVADPLTKIVFFNAAMLDFSGDPWTTKGHGLRLDEMGSTGKYAQRLKSGSDEKYVISLRAQDKIVDKIRKNRKDITLVSFKTTCGATADEQYIAGLNLLKRSSSNLVLANDVQSRLNMVITPEEARYHVTRDRDEALRGLVQMAGLRSHLTFTRSTVVSGEPVPWTSNLVPSSLREVVNYCIKEGAYKPFRGATVGHFACKLSDTQFLTSRRKTNFNELDKLGLVRIKTDGPDSVIAYGFKPSVGGMSQRTIFKDNPGFDCIVHFHCPIKPGSNVPVVSQREYECGSHECGKNTSNGLGVFTVGDAPENFTLLAVYLDQHGPNIVFNKYINPKYVMDFISNNFDLKGKTGGPVEIQEGSADTKWYSERVPELLGAPRDW